MNTETYEDAVTLLRSEANDLLNKSKEGTQSMIDVLLLVAKYLEDKKVEINETKERSTLPDEGNK